jgi:DNA-binding transcriptional MerR regulator
MGILDRIKKKDEEVPTSVPVQEVVDLRNQGMNNDQIINQLRAEGYEFQQIRDAMSQAELKNAASNQNSPAETFPSGQMNDFTPFESNLSPEFSPAPGMEVKDRSVEEIERILEQIIEEKWSDVEDKLGVMEQWKNKVEKDIEKIASKVEDFKSRVDAIEVAITAKVDEYGKSMQEVSVEMQALEKVMGKLVPTLTDSIKELKEVTEKKRD